jgi:hypothetical protein
MPDMTPEDALEVEADRRRRVTGAFRLGKESSPRTREPSSGAQLAYQDLAVSYGEPGAMIVEWFMSLIPDNVPSVTFTQEITDPIPLPPRPTAKQVLELTGWN